MKRNLHLSDVADYILLCKLCFYEKSVIKESSMFCQLRDCVLKSTRICDNTYNKIPIIKVLSGRLKSEVLFFNK